MVQRQNTPFVVDTLPGSGKDFVRKAKLTADAGWCGTSPCRCRTMVVFSTDGTSDQDDLGPGRDNAVPGTWSTETRNTRWTVETTQRAGRPNPRPVARS